MKRNIKYLTIIDNLITIFVLFIFGMIAYFIFPESWLLYGTLGFLAASFITLTINFIEKK